MAAELEARAQQLKAKESNHTTAAQSNPMPAMTAAGNPTPSGAIAKPVTKQLKQKSIKKAAKPAEDAPKPVDNTNL